MGTREEAAQRGRRRAFRIRVQMGQALREARRGAGLSQQFLADRAGISQAGVSRTERGTRSVTLDELSVLSTVVGLDLVVRLYPGPDPVRDRAHVRLLGRLQGQLPRGLAWRTEVPIPLVGDQRAVDAILRMGADQVGFELETRLTDTQATARRASLKQRDAGLGRMILVLADTRANRVALAGSAETLRATFPLEARDVLAALRAGQVPPANGIVLI